MGFQQHGLDFIRTWSFTEDNWLVTLMPLNFVAFSLFDASPTIAIGIGWFVFLGCCAMVAAIAWRFISTTAAIVLLPMFLLSSIFAVGNGGFLGHPISHNSTMFFGMAALFGALVWLERGNRAALAFCAIVSFCAGLSDPWAIAAILAPMGVMASIQMLFTHERGARIRLLILAAMVLMTSALIKIHPIKFLIGSKFTFAGTDGIVDNFVWTAKALTALFNIYPGIGTPPLPLVMTVVSCGLMAWLFLSAIWALLRTMARLPLESLFLAGVAALSIGGVVVAYIAGPIHEQKIAIARMFANVYFFLPLLIALALHFATRHMPRPARIASCVCAALLAMTGVLSSPSVWLHSGPHVRTEEELNLASYLQAHGLHYGYGPYWGSQANAVTWLTNEAVTIRPVAFDRKDGHIFRRGPQTSPLWYLASDVPPGLDKAFVIVADPDNECPKIDICQTGIVKQFGAPQEILTYARLTIYVWDRPLVVR